MVLEKINQSEAIRYMGYGGNVPDEKTQAVIDECEQQLLKVITPKFVYRIFDIQISGEKVSVCNTTLTLSGIDISAHLKGCTKCALLAATLSGGADMLIRRLETSDMTRAVITDCLASAAIEQVCDYADEVISKESPRFNQTWRFSPGYGDLPLDIQSDFLRVLDAPKRIGLNATANNILTPRKSVTAVIGLSEDVITKGRRGCAVCRMKEVCQFRKRGEHCGV